jgi:hypothetical protein
MANSEEQKPIERLHDNLYIVTKAYFNAGERLQSLKIWSEMSLATLSFLVIMLSLCNAYDLNLGCKPQSMGFISVVSAIFVLVYSILVSSRNYGVRSEKMHRCGLELNKLLRQIRLIVSVPANHTEKRYSELDKAYSAILDRYDNYEDVDYLHGKMKKWPEKANWKNKLRYFYHSRIVLWIYFIGPLGAILFFLVSLFK